jgi:hypothetical protein
VLRALSAAVPIACALDEARSMAVPAAVLLQSPTQASVIRSAA